MSLFNTQALINAFDHAAPIFFNIIIFCGLAALSHFAIKHISGEFQKRHDFFSKSVALARLPIIIVINALLAVTLFKVTVGDLHLIFPFRSKAVIEIIVLWALAWYLYHFIGLFEKDILKSSGHKIDVTAIETSTKVLRLCVIIVTLLIMMPVLGYEITGVLTLGAASSLVLGLASRDLLANFFGGLIIYIDNPFGIGDWIKCPEKNIEGTVVDIGWRLTCIRTFERRPLFVPNSFFSQATVENPSRMKNRRLKHFLSLPYAHADKLSTIIDEIRAHLQQSPHIVASLPCFVHVTKLTSLGCECMIYCFTREKEWEKFLDVQQSVMLDILSIVKKNAATLGFDDSKIVLQYHN